MTRSLASLGHGIVEVGIVGSAVIVAGIAQVLAEAGIRVRVHVDGSGGNVLAGQSIAFARKMIERKATKGFLSTSQAEAACAAMEVTGEIEDLRGCDLVIESLLAPPQATRELLMRLERVLRPDALIGLNTSAHTVTSLASDAHFPGRVAGLHFFDPVPLMRVVEVIAGLRTDDTVVTRLEALISQIGHQPIAVKDSPGFVVNHIGRALLTEGMRIVSEQIAPVATVDEIVRDTLGLRMGPFELLDLIGVDVSHPVTEQIYHDFHEEARLRPTSLLSMHVAAGLLGRKTGKGFYRYSSDKAETIGLTTSPSMQADGPAIWCDPSDPVLSEALLRHLTKTSAVADPGSRPAATSLCLVSPCGEDATNAALRLGLDPVRTVAVDAVSGLAGRVTLMGSPALSLACRNAALSLFERAGAVSWIEDSPGFVAQRVLASIVNMACDVAQKGIASPPDIDRSVQIALGYPIGPLSMGDRFGPKRVVQILDGLYAFYGEERYRASPWLRRRAALDVSLLTVSSTANLARAA